MHLLPWEDQVAPRPPYQTQQVQQVHQVERSLEESRLQIALATNSERSDATNGTKGIATRNKDATNGAPGLTTINKNATNGAKGIATRSIPRCFRSPADARSAGTPPHALDVPKTPPAEAWGWRVPFLLAAPLGVASILLRRCHAIPMDNVMAKSWPCVSVFSSLHRGMRIRRVCSKLRKVLGLEGFTASPLGSFTCNDSYLAFAHQDSSSSAPLFRRARHVPETEAFRRREQSLKREISKIRPYV